MQGHFEICTLTSSVLFSVTTGQLTLSVFAIFLVRPFDDKNVYVTVIFIIQMLQIVLAVRDGF